ncbi:MAG: hypothetical protein GF329_08350 [Candidatus Lokiarchaeota archaeon]|nr:hypothetical protein [Candidatus Lokiarchaeota archaeon]
MKRDLKRVTHSMILAKVRGAGDSVTGHGRGHSQKMRLIESACTCQAYGRGI